MTVHQVKPEYTRIVAAIPHSVSDAHYWQWQGDPAVKAWRDRWTDWFTDELFGSRIPGVSVVKAKMSRLECDAERLEDEEDRLCRFAHIGKSERMQEWILGNAMWRNMYLADWYRYRADYRCDSAEGCLRSALYVLAAHADGVAGAVPKRNMTKQ